MKLRLLRMKPVGSHFIFLLFYYSNIVYIFYFVFNFVQFCKSQFIDFREGLERSEAIFVALQLVNKIEDLSGLLFIENEGVVGYFVYHF